MLNLKMIDCESYIYISRSKEKWGYGGLSEYLFDGVRAEVTNKSDWYKLNKKPLIMTKKKSNEKINKRYELKAGYISSDLMPNIITYEQYQTEEYDEIISLYELKYDEIDGGYEEEVFEITEIYSRDNFEFIPKKYNSLVSLLTQLEYPEEIWQDKPCKISSEEMFEIIRNYIKSHIDIKVAQITSDYDFHFEVAKQIGLANAYTKQVDINNSWANKRRKPKWVSQMISSKKEVVLNLKRKPSDNGYGSGCSLAPEIVGENQLDLENKVEQYLSELIQMINKKYCECPNCQAWGIVEVE